MSTAHLERLRKSLEKNHWKLIAENPGNHLNISAIWSISRPNGDNQLSLVFEGQSEGDALPIEKAYGCHVAKKTDLSLIHI